MMGRHCSIPKNVILKDRMGHAMQKRIFQVYVNSKDPDQGLLCPQTESLNTEECFNEEQISG